MDQHAVLVRLGIELDRLDRGEPVARRLALGRVGSFVSDGSGDFAIAFSTAERIPHGGPPSRTVERLTNDATSPLFLAAVEAVEEAIYNSLLRATTVTGHRGRTVEAIPVEPVRELLKRHGRLGAAP